MSIKLTVVDGSWLCVQIGDQVRKIGKVFLKLGSGFGDKAETEMTDFVTNGIVGQSHLIAEFNVHAPVCLDGLTYEMICTFGDRYPTEAGVRLSRSQIGSGTRMMRSVTQIINDGLVGEHDRRE